MLYAIDLPSQDYEVSSNIIYPQVNGIYKPFGIVDGVTAYKHQTQNYYLFRFGGVFWLIADSPNISANIIIDIYDSGSTILNEPPVGGWPAGSTVALPIELASFTAEVIDHSVMLSWKTASETNNVGFDLERSADGNVFQRLAFITGKGTTTEQQSYSFIDQENLSTGQYYYRLKQMDLDGAFTYSDFLSVSLEVPHENKPKVFPNPISLSDHFINLTNLPRELRFIRLLNNQGQLLKTWHDEDSRSLNISQLNPGTYILQIISASKSYSIKFLKI